MSGNMNDFGQFTTTAVKTDKKAVESKADVEKEKKKPAAPKVTKEQVKFLKDISKENRRRSSLMTAETDQKKEWNRKVRTIQDLHAAFPDRFNREYGKIHANTPLEGVDYILDGMKDELDGTGSFERVIFFLIQGADSLESISREFPDFPIRLEGLKEDLVQEMDKFGPLIQEGLVLHPAWGKMCWGKRMALFAFTLLWKTHKKATDPEFRRWLKNPKLDEEEHATVIA